MLTKKDLVDTIKVCRCGVYVKCNFVRDNGEGFSSGCYFKVSKANALAVLRASHLESGEYLIFEVSADGAVFIG